MLAATRKSMEFSIVGGMALNPLPQATGMGGRGGDRQRHRDEHAHEQQNQQ
jgi:hypothetical protein